MGSYTIRKGKLSSEQREEIHRRYFNRLKSGEQVSQIADAFGIYRKWVREVALQVERHINEKTPGGDTHGGQQTNAA